MGTQKQTIEFILHQLNDEKVFSARPMFGEYALYVEEKVVALVCDNQLYIKNVQASKELVPQCELASPYPGAKPHILVDETLILQRTDLGQILQNVAQELRSARPRRKAPSPSKKKASPPERIRKKRTKGEG